MSIKGESMNAQELSAPPQLSPTSLVQQVQILMDGLDSLDDMMRTLHGRLFDPEPTTVEIPVVVAAKTETMESALRVCKHTQERMHALLSEMCERA